MNTTISKTKHIDELHFEHQLWENQIRFYRDELLIYQKRLEEIASKNTAEDVRKKIEHFQNQFILQSEQIDTLMHDIKIHENWISKYAKENPLNIEQEYFADHESTRERMTRFIEIYNELKKEFNSFLLERM